MEQNTVLKPWLDAITNEDLFQAGKLARQAIYLDQSLWNEYADYIIHKFDAQEQRRVAIKVLNNPLLLDEMNKELALSLFQSLRIEDIQTKPETFSIWVDTLKPKELQLIHPDKSWDKIPFSLTHPIEQTLKPLVSKLQKISQQLSLYDQNDFLTPITKKLLTWVQETPQLIKHIGLSELYKVTPSHTLLAPLEPLYPNKKELYDDFLKTTLKNYSLTVEEANVFIQPLAKYYLNDNTSIKNFCPALLAAENHQFELADAWLAAGAPFDLPHKTLGSYAVHRTLRKKMSEITPYFEKYQKHILPGKPLENEHWIQVWETRHKMERQTDIGQYGRFLEQQGLGTPPVEWMMLAAGNNNAKAVLDLLQTNLKITDKDSEGNNLWHVIMNGSFSPHYQKTYKNLYTHSGEKITSSQKNDVAAALVIDALLKSGADLLERTNLAGQLPMTCAGKNRFKFTKTLFPILTEQMDKILLAIKKPSLSGKNIKMEDISQAEHLKKLLKPETFSKLEGKWLHQKNSEIIHSNPKKISAL